MTSAARGGKGVSYQRPLRMTFGMSLCFARRRPPEPLLFCRSDPIKVTRPYRGPGSVFAAPKSIFGVDAIGSDIPVRVTPPFSAAFWLGREHERPVRRRTAHVNCHDPVLVYPKLAPMFPFAVPTGNADTLYLVVSASQHFLNRAATGGAPYRVMLGRRCPWVMPCAQPEIELVVGRAYAGAPGRSLTKQGAKHHDQPWTHRNCLVVIAVGGVSNV